VVVTFTFPNAPVTLLGVICHVGIEPTDAASRDTRGAIQRSPTFPVGGFVLASVLFGYRLHRAQWI